MPPKLSIKQREQLQRALALHQAGHLEEAAALYEGLLRTFPDFPYLLTQLGTLALQTGKIALSVQLYDKSVKIDPNQPVALANCGHAYAKLGKFDQAIACYQSVISIAPTDISAYINLSNLLSDLKRHKDALGCLNQAISLNPDNARLYVNIGIVLSELGQHDSALVNFDRAISINPNQANVHSNRGNALRKLKRYEEALDSFDAAISIKPDYANAYCNKSNVLSELNRFEEALACCERAISINPGQALFYNVQGSILHNLKRYEEALSSLKQSISRRPGFAEAYSNLGVVLNDTGRYVQALASMDRAIALNPEYGEAYCNRGFVLNNLKRYDEALISLDRAIALNPEYAEAYNYRSVVLNNLKRYEEALASLDRAIALNPNSADAHNRRGMILSEMKRDDEAFASFDLAIALNPEYAEAYNNRGNILRSYERYDEAVVDYERAFSLNENIDYLKGQYIDTSMQICAWAAYFDNLKSLLDGVKKNKKQSMPFSLLVFTDNAKLQRQAAEIFVAENLAVNNGLPEIGKRLRHEKIKIGYFSSDFHNHATMHLMAEMFERHDRSRFELVAFSFGPHSEDSWKLRVAVCFDQFIDVQSMSDREVALMARDKGIDIAVDLKGFTQDSRPGIFAERAAPIQVSYLGYPGTMGAQFMDYLIADRMLIPNDKQQFYSEKIVYLPNSYQVNDTNRPPNNKIFTRAEVGLPEEGLVFCCFNNTKKILPEVFDVWMRLLKQIEGSVLWLFESLPSAAASLLKEAESRDVGSSRIVFAKRMPIEDHLARIPVADLFLDTFPYNAHTTASDALRTGLPLITCAGESFASRVAASLLNAVGMQELITHSLEEYEALAFELSRNPEQLEQIRAKLIANLPTAPLYDTALFTKHIEAAYREMYERYQNDQPPDHIYVR